MKEGVGQITNDFNNSKRLAINGHGIYTLDRDSRDLQIEGEWSFGGDAYKMIGVIAMKVVDILDGKNHDYLVFGRDISLKSHKGTIPFSFKTNDIWYLKTSTGLSEEDEKFLRLYKTLSRTRQVEERERKISLDKIIDNHIREERERITHLLNDTKGVGNEFELF